MRSAQSYPLDPTVIRPERHRLRHQRSVKKRIRSSVSAGPTIATLQRCGCTYQTHTIPDEKPQTCRPCSASADVSSISSSTTDSAEQHAAGKNKMCTTIEKMLHNKHRVTKCVREQSVKLLNNDLLPAQDHLATTLLLRANQSGNKINRSPADYLIDRQRSIREQIYQKDDTFERLDERPRLMVRDKGKYGFEGRFLSNTDRKPSETHAGDGRVLNAKTDSKIHYCEYNQFDEERCSPDGTQYSRINRRFTRKTNKYFVPFTNNNEMEEEPVLKNSFVGAENYVANFVATTGGKVVEKDIPTKREQLNGFDARAEQSPACSKREHQGLISTARLSESANPQPSVKMFYENPHLKDPSGSSMLPAVTESSSDQVLMSRSTNTSPVLSKAQSTNTTAVEEWTPQMSLAVGKDAAKRNQSFHRPFHVIQPLLFVLAMFTVSMSGAYVGVMVASAACGTFSEVECEPSILQWLFSSRRHIRAF